MSFTGRIGYKQDLSVYVMTLAHKLSHMACCPESHVLRYQGKSTLFYMQTTVISMWSNSLSVPPFSRHGTVPKRVIFFNQNNPFNYEYVTAPLEVNILLYGPTVIK